MSHCIIHGYELCCICLIKNATIKNNRLEFNFKSLKKEININVFICDACINAYYIKEITQEEILKNLIIRIHPSIKEDIMNKSGFQWNKIINC